MLISPMFLGQRGEVVEKGSRGVARGSYTEWWCGHGPTMPPGGVAPLCLSPSRLLAPGVLGKIGGLQLFLEFFLKVDFLHKNETPGQFC